MNGISHIRSPPFHPQSNGQAERFVDIFKRALSKMKGEGPTSDNLQIFLRCYRTTPNASINNATPAEIMFGRKIRIPLDMLKPTIKPSTIRNKHMEEQFNRQHGAINRNFQSGQEVYIRDYSTSKPTWQPAKIIENKGLVTYSVNFHNRVHHRHVNQIRPRYKTPSSTTELSFEFLTDVFDMAIHEEPTVNIPAVPRSPEEIRLGNVVKGNPY